MILTIDHGAVRELQLNRPPVNALSPELIAALKKAVEAGPPGRGAGAGAVWDAREILGGSRYSDAADT